MKPYSITRRLITTVLLIELISALCVTGVAMLYERHTHFRAFDVLLRGRADSMLGAVQDAEDANDNVMLDGTEIYAPVDDVYQVVDANGRILGRSANWAAITDSHPSEVDHDTHDLDGATYSAVNVSGRTYRMIRIQGLRIVDPGDKGGGIRRYVTIYYGSAVERVWKSVFRAVSFYAISSLIVLASTGILMSWLLNRGLAPLRELASVASRVSVTSWDFSPPQEARMTRELAPLVAVLEALLQGLQRSFEQQRRFVGDAAHELKTSVAVVKSSIQLLGMKERTAAEYQDGLERSLNDCERMEAVVAQMLTLARLEEAYTANQESLRTEVFQSLESVISELETTAEIHAISIQLQAIQFPLAQLEESQFKLVCTNVLMNALQHSPVGSAITIEVSSDGPWAQVTIRDHGDGISSEDLPHVFERFFRSDRSRSRETGGTGLGLAICKAIVELAHGRIHISSEINVGTTVTIKFHKVD
jgi:signal transduction histidine kinase